MQFDLLLAKINHVIYFSQSPSPFAKTNQDSATGQTTRNLEMLQMTPKLDLLGKSSLYKLL